MLSKVFLLGLFIYLLLERQQEMKRLYSSNNNRNLSEMIVIFLLHPFLSFDNLIIM